MEDEDGMSVVLSRMTSRNAASVKVLYMHQGFGGFFWGGGFGVFFNL